MRRDSNKRPAQPLPVFEQPVLELPLPPLPPPSRKVREEHGDHERGVWTIELF